MGYRTWTLALCFVSAVAFASTPAIEQPSTGAGSSSEALAASGDARPESVERNLGPKNYTVGGAISMGGPVTYNMVGSTISATVGSLRNNSSLWESGTLRVRIFVTTAPISGGFTYWTVAEYPLSFSTLAPGQSVFSLSGSAAVQAVPDGIYYIHIGVFEYEAAGSCGNAAPAFCIDDYITFDGRVQSVGGVYSPYVALPPLSPETGVWWDPAQSGNGYVVSVKHGVLVMQIYSYRPDGEPQWYLTAGPMTNGNRNYVGTLDKYRGGQCISCPAPRTPVLLGNDGTVSIVFDSNASATMTFPGGRISRIVPFDF